jgi:uncharacterized protein (DUF1800 family)
MVDRAAYAQLLRRTGFGPTAADVDAAATKSWSALVDELLDFSSPDPADSAAPPTFTPYQPRAARGLTLAQRQAIRKQRAAELGQTQLWWLDRMQTTSHPLREKLTWFWHGHFATSYVKVEVPQFMYNQNQLLRTEGNGDFEVLTQAVAKDPAMMLWLDTATDKAAHPNENFARECMELFTLGISNYTETDVREAARAFTGWVIDPTTLAWALRPRQHDDGVKTVLGQSGNWGGEDVIHILVNSAASHAWVVSRIWSHFAYPVLPNDPVVADLVPGYAADKNVTNLVRAVLNHPQFTSTQAQTGLAKQPIEWTLGTLRVLGIPFGEHKIVQALTAQGETPFEPPNVGGWPQNEYWLTTASSLARVQIAAQAVDRADLSSIEETPAGDRVDAVAHLLSVAWSPATAKALAAVSANPRELVILALVAPENVLA